MITVIAIKNNRDELCGFEIKGHAGYAEAGSDIVCAAVSSLALNCANSIEAFTEDRIVGNNEEGHMFISLPDTVSDKSKLLLDSFFLGIKSIIDEYKGKYVSLKL